MVAPDPGLIAAGYAATNKPAHTAWNWLWQLIGYTMQWLKGSVVRRFDRLDLALAAADPAVPVGAEFAVSPAALASQYVRATVFAAAPKAGTYPHTCTDGVRVFVAFTAADDSFHVHAYYRAAGVWTELWDYEPAVAPLCIACDGARVFVGLNIADAANVIMLSAVTGAVIDDITLAGSAKPYALACDGANLAVGALDATNATVKACTYTASVLTYVSTTTFGTVANSALIRGVAIAPYYTASTNAVIPMILVAGRNGGAGNVICSLIYGGAVITEAVSDAGGGAYSVTCHGNRIYLAHEHYDVDAAGVDTYCQCRSLYGNRLLWVGPASATDAKQVIAHDGTRVYVPVGEIGAEAATSVFRTDACDGGAQQPEIILADAELTGGCDGSHLIVIDRSGGATDTDLAEIPIAIGPRRFVRTADTDTNRAPGYCLAQPVE